MLAGARTIKTGLAIAISMAICSFFDIQPAIFAGAAALVNLQPTVGMSFYNAREQLFVHFLSIAIAILLGLSLGSNPLVMGLAAIIIIPLCIRFKWRASLSGGVMAAIFILSSPETQFFSHALTRSLAIFIGVGTALVINSTIAPPNYRKPLQQKLLELNKTATESFAQAVHNYINVAPLSAENVEKAQQEIGRLFKDTQKLFKLYQANIGGFSSKKVAQEEAAGEFFDELFSFNKGLWQATRDISFLTDERQKRRLLAGNRPVSQEFAEILELISQTLELFLKFHNDLLAKVERQDFEKPAEANIWQELDNILDNYRSQSPGTSYSLHGLTEVSIITHKVRWAVKGSVLLLTMDFPGEK